MDQLHTAFYTPYGHTMPKKTVSAQLASWLDEKIGSYRGASS